MKKSRTLFPVLALVAVVLVLGTGCRSFTDNLTSTTNPVPTDEFKNRKNSFGDGYIAHVLAKDVENKRQEEIVNLLVTQWLEHYKTGSTDERAKIKDFQLDEIILLERTESDPDIVASVLFSIIPDQIPNDWASFPGQEVASDDTWWHLYAPFGVYKDDNYFWLKLVFNRGN